MPSACDFDTSRVKRTQREHSTQRSLSSRMRCDSSWNLVARTLGTVDTDGAPLYA
jgi:hypothetical protein